MMNTIDVSLCEHKTLDDSSHVFSFNIGNREAVTAWAQHIENLQLERQWYGKGHIKLLIDARQAVNLPIRYLFEILSDYNRAYSDLEPPRITMAFLRSPDTAILDVYLVMAELFEPPLTVQFFTNEEKAYRWLSEAK
jgi:hypothetical protein